MSRFWIKVPERALTFDRLLRFGFVRGVRSYDTSETYHSEGAFKKWFAQDSAVRKQIFLVTKDAPKVSGQLMGMLDKRCAVLGTDYVDLFFIHSFGDYHKLDDAIAMVKSKELKEVDIHALRDATLAHGSTLCADCDGRCSIAAGTQAELGNLTRFLTYHEHHGDRTEARRLYAEMPPEARDWSGADLEAARAACPNRIDFARLLPEVERHLA